MADQFADQAEVYVLGALSPAEKEAFEAHLPVCPACAAEVRTYAPVMADLALTAPPLDPPAGARDRLLRGIVGAPAFGGSAVVRRERISNGGWLAAAAALVIAAGLGAYAMQLRGRVGVLESRLHDAVLRADAGELRVADLRRTALESQSTVAVLTAPDLARIDLAGQPAAPRASARAFWSRSRGMVFTASSLPPPPAGRIYQLWVVTAQPAPISAGLLKPDDNGRVDARFDTPPDIPAPVAIAVTLEPAGGVPAPTGEKYLVGLAH